MISPTHLKRKGPSWFSKRKTIKIFKTLIPLITLQSVGFSCSTIACHDKVGQLNKVRWFPCAYSCIHQPFPLCFLEIIEKQQGEWKKKNIPIFGKIRRQVYSPDSKMCRPPNAAELAEERRKMEREALLGKKTQSGRSRWEPTKTYYGKRKACL